MVANIQPNRLPLNQPRPGLRHLGCDKNGDLEVVRDFGNENDLYRSLLAVRRQTADGPVEFPFDAYSYHYGMLHRGVPVGTLTVTRARDGRIDCEEVYPPLLMETFRDELFTSVKLSIPRSPQSSLRGLRHMIGCMWKDQVSLGSRAAIINAHEKMIPFYRRMGFSILEFCNFVHPLLQTPSVCLFLRADVSDNQFFEEAFDGLADPIPKPVWDAACRLSLKTHRLKVPSIRESERSSPRQLSFAAGSTSLEPTGYREMGDDDSNRLSELASVFPVVADHFSDDPMIISAYPAALGIGKNSTFVDTYLHPPTFIRSMRLATLQNRNVVFAAQPLVGADLLLRIKRSSFELPPRILWASGGYYFPESLERFIGNALAERGCRLEFLHSYGAAEVGHTCFAAIQRLASGEPRFKKVSQAIDAFIDPATQRLSLSHGETTLLTEDTAMEEGGDWRISNASTRLARCVRDELERWTDQQWERRSGYLYASKDRWWVQRREGETTAPPDASGQAGPLTVTEVSYHRFWESFGGSPQTKPNWRLNQVTQTPTDRLDDQAQRIQPSV